MTVKQDISNFFINTKNKLIDLRYNKTFLICCLLSIIYLISGYLKWLELVVSLVALTFMAVLSIQSAFCIFLFLHSFTLSNISYNSFFIITFIGFFVILLVKYIIGLNKKQYEFHKKIAISIASFYVFFLLTSLFKPRYNLAWIYLTYLPLAYLLYAMRSELNISQGMNYMFGGLLTSCSLALLSLTFPQYQYSVLFKQTGMLKQNRFKAFINNPNYLSMRAVFVLTYYMYRYCCNRLSTNKFITIYSLLTIIVLSTISKAGIISLMLMTLVFIIAYLKQDWKKRIKIIGLLIGIICIVCVIFQEYVLNVIERILLLSTSENYITYLLTGRDEIWQLYFNAILSSPFHVLFGHGLITEQVFVANQFGPTEAHNFYIFLLYRFGIIGTIALGYIVYLFIKELNCSKPKIHSYIPAIYLAIISFIDNTMKYYNIVYFMLAFFILFLESKEKQQVQQTSKQSKTKKIKD